jgi:multiple sugar transport system permease protein
MALVIYAGLQAIPQQIYEAAMIDGASFFRRTISITIPSIKYVILVAILIKLIDALKIFAVAYGLTQGGPGHATELLSVYIHRMGFGWNLMVGKASAAAILLLLFAAILTYLLIRLMRRKDEL